VRLIGIVLVWEICLTVFVGSSSEKHFLASFIRRRNLKDRIASRLLRKCKIASGIDASLRVLMVERILMYINPILSTMMMMMTSWMRHRQKFPTPLLRREMRNIGRRS
jgi:hypothetical protein